MQNEQAIMRGDDREAMEEWLEAHELAPEPEPMTEADLEAYFRDYCERNGGLPDLSPDGYDRDEGVIIWTFGD